MFYSFLKIQNLIIYLFLFTHCLNADNKRVVINLLDDSVIKIDPPSLNLHFTPTKGFEALPPFDIALNDISELKLSSRKTEDSLLKFKNSINNLRHQSFKTRENAASIILNLGDGFQNIIKKTINDSLDPEVRWRLREIVKILPPQINSGFDKLRTSGGQYSGYASHFVVKAKYLGELIYLNRNDIKSIESENHQAQVTVFHGLNKSNQPISDINIDFKESLQGEIFKEGYKINDSYKKYGLSLSTLNSYLTVTNIDIPGASGNYSATNFKPIYEGEIRGSFTEKDSYNPSGINYLGLRLGLIKPGSVIVKIYDNNMNQLAQTTTKSFNNELVNFISPIPISHFSIQPIKSISPTVAISDLWFTKPQKKHPIIKNGEPMVVMKSGDQIKCKRIEFIPSLKEDDPDVIISPRTNFSNKLKIKNGMIKSCVFSTKANTYNINYKKFFWVLLEDGTKLLMRQPNENEPISKLNSLPINKLSVSAIWSSREKMVAAPGNLDLKKSQAAIFIRKDPIYLNDFSINQESVSGNRNDGTKITYQFSRVPTIWINELQDKDEKITTINLKDGQKIKCGKECLHEIQSLNETGVKIKFEKNYLNIPKELIQSIEF